MAPVTPLSNGIRMLSHSSLTCRKHDQPTISATSRRSFNTLQTACQNAKTEKQKETNQALFPCVLFQPTSSNTPTQALDQILRKYSTRTPQTPEDHVPELPSNRALGPQPASTMACPRTAWAFMQQATCALNEPINRLGESTVAASQPRHTLACARTA